MLEFIQNVKPITLVSLNLLGVDGCYLGTSAKTYSHKRIRKSNPSSTSPYLLIPCGLGSGMPPGRRFENRPYRPFRYGYHQHNYGYSLSLLANEVNKQTSLQPS